MTEEQIRDARALDESLRDLAGYLFDGCRYDESDTCYNAADAIHHALDAIDRLRTSLEACADDLEAEVEARYRGKLEYPDEQRRYERDMEPVRLAWTALAGEWSEAEPARLETWPDPYAGGGK